MFCPHWSAVVNTDHHSAASDQYSALPDHHSFYQYIYRSTCSLSRYARVAIVYLALFLRPMGHGSSHARSRSTQLRAMIKSGQNVHYIEQSNLWVGKAQGMCARARMRIAHYRVMYIIPRFSSWAEHCCTIYCKRFYEFSGRKHACTQLQIQGCLQIFALTLQFNIDW